MYLIENFFRKNALCLYKKCRGPTGETTAIRNDFISEEFSSSMLRL